MKICVRFENNEDGLIVDYIGITSALKAVRKQYTESDQKKFRNVAKMAHTSVHPSTRTNWLAVTAPVSANSEPKFLKPTQSNSSTWSES